MRGCPPYDLDPDEFLFLDDIHPTAGTHSIVADVAFEPVTFIPVPAAILLFPSALLVLGWLRRRVV